MSRRCLICANINPCREHSDNEQDAELVRNCRAIKALRPFAKALNDWGDDSGQSDRWNVWEHPVAMNVTLGDFREARATLEPLPAAPLCADINRTAVQYLYDSVEGGLPEENAVYSHDTVLDALNGYAALIYERCAIIAESRLSEGVAYSIRAYAKGDVPAAPLSGSVVK